MLACGIAEPTFHEPESLRGGKLFDTLCCCAFEQDCDASGSPASLDMASRTRQPWHKPVQEASRRWNVA